MGCEGGVERKEREGGFDIFEGDERGKREWDFKRGVRVS